MPRAVIVNSSNRSYQGMPLGAMTVATLLRQQHGIETTVVDLPVEEHERLERQIVEFWDEVPLDGSMFVGFSTVCNTMPRSLQLACELRRQRPDMPIVFGGPEITASFRWLTEHFEFIDAVILGEAESVLGALVEWVEGGAPENQPGLWIRAAGEACSPGMAHLVDLDAMPMTDYRTYSGLEPNQRVALEVGRGCPYSCTFCSTKTFFNRRFRLKSPERIVAEIEAIEAAGLGAAEYDFIHDMFTTNRKLVVAVCEALIARDRPMRWSCSSRTDRVDRELLELMWQAGCRDIYFGIETGSQDLQRLIDKKLDLADAERKVALAIELGFNVTCALIMGFLEEREHHLTETVDLFLRLRYRTPGLQSVQLHLLAPMAGTEIHERQTERLRFDGFVSGVSSVNALTAWEETQIRAEPEAFSSFYYLRNDEISRSTYKWLYRFLTEGDPAFTDPADFLAQYGAEAGRRLVMLARAQGPHPIDEVVPHRRTGERRTAARGLESRGTARPARPDNQMPHG